MTQQEMNLLVPQKLRELEREHDIKVGKIPRIPALDGYIDSALAGLGERMKELPREKTKPWDALNRVFTDILAEGDL